MTSIQELSRLVSGRNYNLFEEDLKYFNVKLNELISKSRILIIGGAGSIGSSTVNLICKYNPSHICVVDTNENNLAELTRVIRNSNNSNFDFLTLPIPYGSNHMKKFIRDSDPYDFVLNFAALKHVRSEKNVISILQMLQTNTLDILNLLNWLTEKKDDFVFFNVSTDKAANPVNVLGASKQMMENLIFSYNAKYNAHICFISSRFANVAVSDGSLFYSYLNRFNNVDPLPVPSNTKRFFISLEEAGTICLLSAFCGENGQIYIPKLTAEADLQSLESIAEKIIKKFGFEPEKFYNEFDAVKNISELLKIKKYPLLVTKLDTMGEKDFEEFENMDETPENCSFKLLKKIKFIDRKINIFQVIENIINFDFPRQEKIVENNYLMELINLGTYNFRHNNSSFKLDDRR